MVSLLTCKMVLVFRNDRPCVVRSVVSPLRSAVPRTVVILTNDSSDRNIRSSNSVTFDRVSVPKDSTSVLQGKWPCKSVMIPKARLCMCRPGLVRARSKCISWTCVGLLGPESQSEIVALSVSLVRLKSMVKVPMPSIRVVASLFVASRTRLLCRWQLRW